METGNYFTLFRNIAFIFATVMLAKYTLYLLIAPFYPVMEVLRKIRVTKRQRYSIIYKPLISVIIPAWNEEVGILQTLKSILSNTYSNTEIILINDGSTDRSHGKILNYLSSLEAINPHLRQKIQYFYKENEGKGQALNYGIERANGEIIFTIDADSLLEKNALTNLVEYFKDSRISCVVGRVQIAGNNTITGFIQQLEYLFGFYFKRAHAVMGAEYIMGGACAAFRKVVFKKVGLFDIHNKTEDIEMSIRIKAYGLNGTYAEDVICFTEGASTLTGLINQRLRWKKGRLHTFAKYRQLFFSRKKYHNKLLSFFVLPFSLISEIQLFFEPLSIALLVSYSLISGDYLTLALGTLFVAIIYYANAFFAYGGLNLKLLLLFPFTWPLFYILVCVEYVSLIHSIRLILAGEEIKWQNWERKGITSFT